MPAQDCDRIVIDGFPPGLLDPEINFTRSAAYRPDSRYRLIFVFHGDAAFDHTSLCKDTGEGGPGMSVEPHSFRGLNGSTNVTAAFCQGLVSLNTADDGLSGSVEPGSPSFAFLVGDVLKPLFPDGSDVLPSPRRCVREPVAEVDADRPRHGGLNPSLNPSGQIGRRTGR